MLGKRKKLIESIIPFLIKENIGVNRSKIRGFMVFHKINNRSDFDTAFTGIKGFISQYKLYEAMV